MALTAVLAAASFGVGALGAWQQYQEGQYAKDVSRVEAQSLRQQAQYAQQAAGEQIAAQDYEAEHQIAQGRANVAASGIEETEGSPALMSFTSANQQRINDMYTKYAANVQSAGYDTQASITTSEGEQAAVGAEAAATLDVASSALGSVKEATTPSFAFTSTSGTPGTLWP